MQFKKAVCSAIEGIVLCMFIIIFVMCFIAVTASPPKKDVEIKTLSELRNKCEAKGGVLIVDGTGSPQVCFKKDSVIELIELEQFIQ